MGLKVTKKSQRTHPSLLSEHFQKGGRVVTYQTRAAMGNVRIFWPTLTHVYNGWIRSNGYTVANRKTSWTNPVPLLLECIFWLSPFRFERDRFIKRTSTFIQIYYVYIKKIYSPTVSGSQQIPNQGNHVQRFNFQQGHLNISQWLAKSAPNLRGEETKKHYKFITQFQGVHADLTCSRARWLSCCFCSSWDRDPNCPGWSAICKDKNLSISMLSSTTRWLIK